MKGWDRYSREKHRHLVHKKGISEISRKKNISPKGKNGDLARSHEKRNQSVGIFSADQESHYKTFMGKTVYVAAVQPSPVPN